MKTYKEMAEDALRRAEKQKLTNAKEKAVCTRRSLRFLLCGSRYLHRHLAKRTRFRNAA